MTRETHLVIVLFSGFLQRQDSEGSGMLELDERVHHLVMRSGRRHVTRHAIHAWSDDPSEVAGRYWRNRPGYAQQEWLIAGYSYGGQAAVNLCHELRRRNDGTVVKELHLCDPVRRWRLLPGVAAATGAGSLIIPANVKQVEWVRQCNPRWDMGRPGLFFQPAGHDLVAADESRTVIRPPKVSESQHEFIDSDRTFHDRFLEAVARHLDDGGDCRCDA